MTSRVNFKSKFDEACARGATKAVESLLKKTTNETLDINAQSLESYRFRRKGSSVYVNDTPFRLAVEGGHEAIVSLFLLLKGDRFTSIDTLGEGDGQTPLMAACRLQKWNIVKMLFHHEAIDINIFGRRTGESAFMEALRRDDVTHDVVNMFLNSEKLDITATNRNGMTAFHLVCRWRHRHKAIISTVDLLKMFLESRHGSKIELNKPDEYGLTPFMDLWRNQDGPAVQLLLDDSRLNTINTPCKDEGLTPFMHACLKSRFSSTVDVLLRDRRVDRLAVNNEGRNALMELCYFLSFTADQEVRFRVFEMLLLEKCFCMNAVDSEGFTVLEIYLNELYDNWVFREEDGYEVDVRVVRMLIDAWLEQKTKNRDAIDTVSPLFSFEPGLLDTYLNPFLLPGFDHFCRPSIIQKLGEYVGRGSGHIDEIYAVLIAQQIDRLAVNDNGRNALMQLCSDNFFSADEAVRFHVFEMLLLEKCFCMNVVDSEGFTVLEIYLNELYDNWVFREEDGYDFAENTSENNVRVVRMLIDAWLEQKTKNSDAIDTVSPLFSFEPGLLDTYLNPFLLPDFDHFCRPSIIQTVGEYIGQGNDHIDEIYAVLIAQQI